MPDGEISFEVRGSPAVQGNLRVSMAGGRGHVYSPSDRSLKDWRHAIATEARAVAPDELWTGPVRVQLAFRVVQPASIPSFRGRGKKRAPVKSWPHKRPDLDKFVRAVFDALTQVVWVDDSQVVDLRATKDYGVPGVSVTVSRVNGE